MTHTIATSSNGTSWTGQGLTVFDEYGTGGLDIGWNGTQWIAVGDSYNAGNVFATSANGTTWDGRGDGGSDLSIGNGVFSIPAPNLYPPVDSLGGDRSCYADS